MRHQVRGVTGIAQVREVRVTRRQPVTVRLSDGLVNDCPQLSRLGPAQERIDPRTGYAKVTVPNLAERWAGARPAKTLVGPYRAPKPKIPRTPAGTRVTDNAAKAFRDRAKISNDEIDAYIRAFAQANGATVTKITSLMRKNARDAIAHGQGIQQYAQK